MGSRVPALDLRHSCKASWCPSKSTEVDTSPMDKVHSVPRWVKSLYSENGQHRFSVPHRIRISENNTLIMEKSNGNVNNDDL